MVRRNAIQRLTANLANRHCPLIMGILNVTPDSFSDGGEFELPIVALQHAERMIKAGAAIVDVGGESTRPGAQPVPAADQIARVTPIIKGICELAQETLISIDTRSARVAEAAIDAGAAIINDVSAMCDDPEMAELARDRKVPVVLMHLRGTPMTMQQGDVPFYENVVQEVAGFLAERYFWALEQGLVREQIILDPGIGFGKRLEDNLQILRSLPQFKSLGAPLLLGVSRKSFMDHLLNLPEPRERLLPSIACALKAAQESVDILRVHDVRETQLALRMWAALEDPCSSDN